MSSTLFQIVKTFRNKNKKISYLMIGFGRCCWFVGGTCRRRVRPSYWATGADWCGPNWQRRNSILRRGLQETGRTRAAAGQDQTGWARKTGAAGSTTTATMRMLAELVRIGRSRRTEGRHPRTKAPRAPFMSPWRISSDKTFVDHT